MTKLWELSDEDQETIIPIMLSHHGEVIGKLSSPYSWIYTLKEKYSSDYLIAKAPKFGVDVTALDARTRLLKMLQEINVIHRICMHSLVHRFGRIELVLGVPFLISVKRHLNLRDAMEEGPIRAVDALAVAIQVARGIEYVQSKGFICHQDLKAENIFLDSISKKFVTTGDYPYAYQAFLADFDIVDRAVLFAQPYGSRPYHAAEQYMKDRRPRYDKIDVFALAVNLVEMLTGGMHPIGVRTTDAWPKSTLGNKWNREDPWKIWSRNPVINPALSLNCNDMLRGLIMEMLSSDYSLRPSMSVVKRRLLMCLQDIDRQTSESLLMYLQRADEAATTNTEAGWPYMDELVARINKTYNSDL